MITIKRAKVKESFKDRIFEIIVHLIVGFCVLICAYPIYLVVINSFSDPNIVAKGEVFILPKGFTLDAYKLTFENGSVMRGYWNTLWYTLVGVGLNMLLTIPAAYALSKKELMGGKFVMKLVVISMYFSGGLIPFYTLIKSLGLLNNWWVIPLNGAVASSNLIIARTFFSSGVPRELEEAAEVDGCTVFQTFIKIVLPLSKAMLSVIALYYMVGRWNAYTPALYYMPRTQELWPLQMVLRQILIEASKTALDSSELADYYAKIANQMKYAVIVVSSAPLLIIYPFVQKYFEKGVMLGSVKG